ncbi:MAG: flavin reductase family protein [Lachnospiraceae bacterium]|nr:flavin reductase family protein [Lachnospiraceae bacterium]
MAKQIWKPGNMLYPLPVVMVSVRDKKGNDNIITVAWAGTVCTNPPMVSISVRPERHSYQMIKESGEFVINLVTKDLVFATDYCGVKSGRDVDKFKEMKLKKEKAEKVAAPLIAQSPVNLECRVTECKELGSHHMFVAEIVSVHIDEKYMDEKGKFHLNETGLVTYSHGEYFALGKRLGRFGYSVKKK